MGLELKTVVSVRRVAAMMFCVAGCVGVWGCGKSVDASTPKKAAEAFRAAVFGGDTATIHEVSVGTDEEVKAVDGMSKFLYASRRVGAAIKEKFGDSAVPPGMVPEDNGAAEVEAMDEKIDGDVATLTKKGSVGGPSEHTLKKVGGSWKVNLSSADVHDHMDEMKQMAPMAGALDEVTDGIKAGKYKTAEEMKMDLMAKMSAMGPK